MAGKRHQPKAAPGRKSGSGLPGRLSDAGAAAILRASVNKHHELRPEAEAIAESILSQTDPFSVAEDVRDAVCQYDYDDLKGRACGRSGCYVEPTEAAWEMLDEAVEPFVREMNRYLELGLGDQARQFCIGILLGLYRTRDSENDVLGWSRRRYGIWRQTDEAEAARVTQRFRARAFAGVGLGPENHRQKSDTRSRKGAPP